MRLAVCWPAGRQSHAENLCKRSALVRSSAIGNRELEKERCISNRLEKRHRKRLSSNLGSSSLVRWCALSTRYHRRYRRRRVSCIPASFVRSHLSASSPCIRSICQRLGYNHSFWIWSASFALPCLSLNDNISINRFPLPHKDTALDKSIVLQQSHCSHECINTWIF